MNNVNVPEAPKCEFQDLKIVGICGSIRSGSNTKKALQIALEGCQSLKCKIELLDLNDYPLPLRDGLDNQSRAKPLPEVALRFREVVRSASGLILATPEYHNGLSGVLKNAIDFLTFEETKSKPVGLIATSGGAMGGFEALSQLRQICRSLHCWVIPDQCGIPFAAKVFDEKGNVNDPELRKRLTQVGKTVAKFCYLHGNAKANEFLQALEDAFENPGGVKRKRDSE